MFEMDTTMFLLRSRSNWYLMLYFNCCYDISFDELIVQHHNATINVDGSGVIYYPAHRQFSLDFDQRLFLDRFVDIVFGSRMITHKSPISQSHYYCDKVSSVLKMMERR